MVFRRAALSFLSVFIVAAAACGGDDGGPSGPPCEQLAKRFCDKARSCASDPNRETACRWFYGTNKSLGRNCPVCEGGVIDRLCKDPTKTPEQIDRCAAIFDQAACEPSSEGPAVRVPADCGDILACGGGPCMN